MPAHVGAPLGKFLVSRVEQFPPVSLRPWPATLLVPSPEVEQLEAPSVMSTTCKFPPRQPRGAAPATCRAELVDRSLQSCREVGAATRILRIVRTETTAAVADTGGPATGTDSSIHIAQEVRCRHLVQSGVGLGVAAFRVGSVVGVRSDLLIRGGLGVTPVGLFGPQPPA